MAQRKYRLQALLTIKARMKKRAEMALAKSIVELKESKERLEELRSEKDEIVEDWKRARADMKGKMSGGALIGEGNIHVNFLRKLKEDEEAKQGEIEDQELVVEDCEAKVISARHEYVEACKELKIMEKHKELWEKKMKDELSKREEREMDELGGIIHRLRKWRGEKSLFEI